MGLLDPPALTPQQAAVRYGVRRRDLPGVAAMPVLVMASPPAFETNATTQISSSVLVPPDAGNFAVSGGSTRRGSSFPDTTGISTTGMYGVTTASPYALDFILDTVDSTGRFEVYHKENGTGCRLLVQVDGQWQYATSGPTWKTTSGSRVFGLVTLGAAGVYRLRLECDAGFVFAGLQIAPTDAVTPAGSTRRRVVIIGDSYTEPTINDTGDYCSWDGYAQLLSYAIGADVWSAAAGGTGYLQPNASPAKTNLAGRISEITPYVDGAEVWCAYGINDYGNFTAAAIAAAALTDYQTILDAGAEKLVVVGPYWPRGIFYTATNLLATREAIKASAASVRATFLDPLNLPISATQPTATTLAATTGASAVTIQTVAALGTSDYYVQIGTGTNAEVRYVGGQTGSGPYTYGFGTTGHGGALQNIHTSGEAVTPVGPAFITGNGKQGTPQSNGTADRYTGADATHPTIAGHRNLAGILYSLYSASLPG